MKRARAKVALGMATAGVILAMVGSASASSVCVNIQTTVQGKTVTIHRCVTH